jgi:hypothetical protein
LSNVRKDADCMGAAMPLHILQDSNLQIREIFGLNACGLAAPFPHFIPGLPQLVDFYQTYAGPAVLSAKDSGERSRWQGREDS